MLMNERLIRLFMGFPVRAPWGFWGVSGDTPAPPSARPRLFMGFPVRAPWGFWGVSGDTPAPPSADVFVFGGHPRPHGLPRGLLLLAGLTALFAVSAAAPGAAQPMDVFEVRDVAVDVTAETAAKARELALIEGRKLAFD